MHAETTAQPRIHRGPHQIEVFVPDRLPAELMIVLSRQLMIVSLGDQPLKIQLPPESSLDSASIRARRGGTLICVPLASPCGDPLW